MRRKGNIALSQLNLTNDITANENKAFGCLSAVFGLHSGIHFVLSIAVNYHWQHHRVAEASPSAFVR